MATFVLVHGAYHGGWCWRDVASRLVAAGHAVFTPTLTGLGERAHLATPDVDLETHVADLIAIFDFEDLADVILVGHSYGGMVVGTVADRLADRIRGLVYLDALIPENGKSVTDIQPPARRQAMSDSVAAGNGWQLPANSAAYYDVEDAKLAAWVDAKCRPHPWATFTQAARLTGAADGIGQTTYIRCTNTKLAYLEQFVDQAEAAESWRVVYLDAGHDCMVTEPAAVASLLLDHA
jgi:pimeloyl-ACP methyl ester carboxylesterase